VTLVGFTLTRRPVPAREGPCALRGSRAAGHRRTLGAPVEKIDPIDAITAAPAHAQRGARSGKILVAPHGLV
jgi:hypothetical protein